jgi:hypothetical protein
MFVLRNGKANQIFNVDGIGNIFFMGRRSRDEGTNFHAIGAEENGLLPKNEIGGVETHGCASLGVHNG